MDNIDNEVTEIRRMPEAVDDAPVEHAAKVSPGTVLGNYRLLDVIGAGLTSEVYEAENMLARRRCAVKVFHPEMNIGPVVFGRYAHEAKRILGLAHPCITPVFYSGKADGQSFSVMALEQGSDLRSLVRHKAPLSRRVYLPIITGICEALTDVHAQGLFHGRLHGGQVMLQLSEQATAVKVLDLGTHHLLPGIKETSSEWQRRAEDAICFSPEQAKGLDPDARSDIYALSVMLYEMVTGKVPFLAKTFEETLEQHVSEDPVSPGTLAQVPSAVEETIMRGLSKDPRKRIHSVEALLAGLDPRHATGAHKAVGAAGARPLGLTPSQSREYELSSMDPAAPGQVAPAATLQQAMPVEPDDNLDMAVPKNRTWLLIVALVLALGIAGGGVYLFLFTGKKVKKSPGKRPRPAPARTVPREAPSPKKVKKQAAPKKRAAAAAPAPAAEPAPAPTEPAKHAPRVIRPVARTTGTPTPGESLRIRGVGLNRGTGSVGIQTGHAKAQVFVNGHLRGRGAAVDLSDLPVRTHRIEIKVDGKLVGKKDVEIKKGEKLELAF